MSNAILSTNKFVLSVRFMPKRFYFIAALILFTFLLSALFLSFPACPAAKTFHSDAYHFQFQYPAHWDARCCGMDGPLSASAQHLITLADTTTLNSDARAPFNGIAIFLDENHARVPLTEYTAHEQDDFIAARLGLGWRSFPINTRNAFHVQEGHMSAFALGGRQSVILQNAANDALSRIYIPMANARVLIVAAPLGQNAAWDVELNKILATFYFDP